MNNLHRESLKTSTNKIKVYNEWANSYDNYVESINYQGPKELTKILINLIDNFPTNIGIHRRELERLKILDFGCGTGLVATEIRKHNIICSLHGIDISLNMIKKAMDKNVYNRILHIDILKEEFPNNLKYDYIVSSGVFLEGHAPFIIINKIFKLLKSLGILIITVRDSYKNSNIMDFNKYILNNKNFRLISVRDINYLDNVKCKLIIMRKNN